ncbi:MAG: TIGR01620 family protein [Pseudomonadota bacterium]
MTDRRGPTVIEDLDALPEASAGPDVAPDVDAQPTAVMAGFQRSARRPSLAARIFFGAVTTLLLMAVGLWFWETVEALIARNIWLARAAMALAAVAGLALFSIVVAELAALSRLKRTDRVRELAGRARRSADRAGAERTLDMLDRLYRNRAEIAAGRSAVASKRAELLDADAMLDLAERELLAPLDQAAEAAARRGAQRVAAATALIPLALIDVLAALAVNVRMVREIAEIYGGRAGWLGSWRLMRAVVAHLVAAGALAVGDDLIGPALGGGVVAKLSRRFGEGLVNGALTARIGIAAIEVCRPLPFEALEKPGVAGLIRSAFSDLSRRGDD